MSQFSTMTTSERKMQAAAICREVQGEEGSHSVSSLLCCLILELFRSFSLFLLLHQFFSASVSSSPSLPPHILLLSAPSYAFYHTYQHRHGFKTITYSTNLRPTRINFTVRSSIHWTLPDSLYRRYEPTICQGSGCQPSLLRP